MEQIEKHLKNLSLIETPVSIHQSVMRKINYKRVQPVLLTALCLLVFNFVLIVWRINTKLVEAEFIDMINDFFEVLSFNSLFVSTVLNSFFEIVSLQLTLSVFVSLTGAIYVGRKMSIYKFA